MGERFGAVPVWCKLEKSCEKTLKQVRQRYDLREFERARERYDSDQVFGKNLWDD